MTGTAAHLRAVIDRDFHGVQRHWALAHSIPPTTVSDCLLGKSMSAARENQIRRALRLPAVADPIKIAPPGHGKHRPYKQLSVCVPPELAAAIAHQAKRSGRSVSTFVRDAVCLALDNAA